MNDIFCAVYSPTDSGMVAVWQPEQFHGIVDYDTWERELLEDADISRHIQNGAFVPLNVHADGAYECAIRAGSAETPATLFWTERAVIFWFHPSHTYSQPRRSRHQWP